MSERLTVLLVEDHRPLAESIEALEKPMKPKGCRCRLMAPANAMVVSPERMERQA